MAAVWVRVRADLRRDWRALVALAAIVGLMGGIALATFAGARRTDTAVSRFLKWSGPTDGQVQAPPGSFAALARLPQVAYTDIAAFMLAFPVTAEGKPAVS